MSNLLSYAPKVAALPLSTRPIVIGSLLESAGVPFSERPQIARSVLDTVASDLVSQDPGSQGTVTREHSPPRNDDIAKSPVPPSTPTPAGGDGVLRDSPKGPLEMLQEVAVLEQ